MGGTMALADGGAAAAAAAPRYEASCSESPAGSPSREVWLCLLCRAATMLPPPSCCLTKLAYGWEADANSWWLRIGPGPTFEDVEDTLERVFVAFAAARSNRCALSSSSLLVAADSLVAEASIGVMGFDTAVVPIRMA